MGDFLAELRRRHIYRIGAGYVIGAWAVVQVLDVLSQLWALPDWIAQPITIVLAIGFPITLIVAWLIEGKAQEAVASAVRSPATATDWILASALAAVLAFIAYERFIPVQPVVTEIEAAVPIDDISIAVLPFTNLSSDPEQEFFSDGMTEEITAALAKVQDLRVVGRTSAFQFKGQNEDLRAIGEALGASHLIEGSVRKDGNELRITAQLIRASDGSHVWAESYDRELTGVFAVQEEIAQAIAGALRVPLGLSEGGQLVANRTGDLESYEQFLRARALYLSREIAESITVLESITARDPDFAPAWALLAQAHIQARNYDTTYGANGRFDYVGQLS